MTRTCLDCHKPLSRQNVVGRCRSCASRVIGKSETRRAALARTRSAMPNISSIMRAVSLRKIEWCPLEYRDDYRKIARNAGYSAAEAKAIILAQVARDIDLHQRSGVLPRTGEREQR